MDTKNSSQDIFPPSSAPSNTLDLELPWQPGFGYGSASCATSKQSALKGKGKQVLTLY